MQQLFLFFAFFSSFQFTSHVTANRLSLSNKPQTDHRDVNKWTVLYSKLIRVGVYENRHLSCSAAAATATSQHIGYRLLCCIASYTCTHFFTLISIKETLVHLFTYLHFFLAFSLPSYFTFMNTLMFLYDGSIKSECRPSTKWVGRFSRAKPIRAMVQRTSHESM